MKTKFTIEYAEKLAEERYKMSGIAGTDSIIAIIRQGYVDGYIKAIEETAAPELLDVIEFMLEAINEADPRELHYDNHPLKKAYDKATELTQP